jgi:uncharacterized protein (DUF2147 family)
MKKLILGLSIMFGSVVFVSAQTATPAKTKPATATAKVVKTDKTVAVTTTTTAKPATAKPAASTTAPLKADGTPDKRYKENKTTEKTVVGPKKADGTADMRYKTNKTVKGKG